MTAGRILVKSSSFGAFLGRQGLLLGRSALSSVGCAVGGVVLRGVVCGAGGTSAGSGSGSLNQRRQRKQQQYLASSTASFSSSSSSVRDPPPPPRQQQLPHDVGGSLEAYGPVPLKPKDNATLLAWEQQCHALFALLASQEPPVITTDELRRAIESLSPAQHETWSYYEKWSAGMAMLLLEKGVVMPSDLRRALFGDASSDSDSGSSGTASPRFAAGEAVRVKPYANPHGNLNVEWRRPHVRTPGYVYGATGTIERVCGHHGDPSWLAFGLEAPQVQLYRVRFAQSELWPEYSSPDGDDSNHDDDVVEVEIYEHWLESADDSAPPQYPDQTLFDHTGTGDDCLHHDHGHDHSHHHDDLDHVHEARPLVEERAIQREGSPRPGQELFFALKGLLLEQQVVTADALREMCERLDTAGQRLDGATLVLQAWLDASFRERLIADPAKAAGELGISTTNANAPTVLAVVPNTPETHNLVVCTLCSCYPSGLLGIAPSWYRSRTYRARAVREPRVVLAGDFGLDLSQIAHKRIRVHDSTADHRYLVLPERPAGTESFSADALRALITRDTMVGVALPSALNGP